MQEPRAQRTLVKSPPELWAEVSDVEALARHLGEFGEIRITRLDPETTVAWEGDRACGTVALEPSGWGTKVTITAKLAEVPEPQAPAAEPVAEAEPVADPDVLAPEPDAAEPEARPRRSPRRRCSHPSSPAEPAAAARARRSDRSPRSSPSAGCRARARPRADPAAAEAPKVGFFARLFGRRRKVEAVVEVEPVAVEPDPEPEPVAVEPEPIAVEPEPEAGRRGGARAGSPGPEP